MSFNSIHIQKVCALGLIIASFAFPLQFCGSTTQPTVQTLSFADQSVSFQNTSCSTSITLLNNASIGYSLAFMTGTFQDENGEEFQVEFNQSEVADRFEPITIAAGASSEGNVTFDLQNSNLTPPISATVIVIGISGQQVTHFVGDFTCQ